jgi:hypothetical protein
MSDIGDRDGEPTVPLKTWITVGGALRWTISVKLPGSHSGPSGASSMS